MADARTETNNLIDLMFGYALRIEVVLVDGRLN